MHIQIQRKDITIDGLFGVIYVDGVYTCLSLENKVLAIAPGTYTLELTFSPEFRQVMPLLDVPGRQAIRIHWANYPHELKGCIAPGERRDGDALDNSREAFAHLFHKIQTAVVTHEAVTVSIQ